MPQLEFTIWLSNAIVNWIVVLIFVLFINNTASTFTNHLIDPTNTNTENNENSWPW